jgi:hypothetical protein
MNNKDILEYTLEDMKDLIEYSHNEKIHTPPPIVTYYRNDYDGPLFSIMLRAFNDNEKTITFATAMMLNAILPIDKVAVTMDASVRKVDKDDFKDSEYIRPSQDPNSVDVVWSNIIERSGEVHSAGCEYKIEDKTGRLVWNKESQKLYEGVGNVDQGGLITELVMASYTADPSTMNKLAGVDNDKERSIEYFTPLMMFLTQMDYIVMCSDDGFKFLESLGIDDAEQFITMEQYLKNTEEE